MKNRNQILKILKLLLIWTVIIFVFGEVAARIFVEFPLEFKDEKTTSFRFDEELGWFPKEGVTAVHHAKFSLEITNNNDGFRDVEHVKDPNRKSIAVLGDSFVWGYDVEADKRITSRMNDFLPEWNIYNMGVSGYGTDQEYLLLKKWFPIYNPDVVYLVMHSNDSIDNRFNYNYMYYKPYFEMDNDELVVKGIPVPKCFRYQQVAHPILFKSKFVQAIALLYNRLFKPEQRKVPDLRLELLREMRDYVEGNGAEFRLVFTYEAKDQKEKNFLETEGIHYQYLPTRHKFKNYGRHWNAEGHEYVAFKILESLYRDGLITDEDIEMNPDGI